MLAYRRLDAKLSDVLVEDCDGTCNSDNDKRLGSGDGKDDGSQDRGQQDFVDAVVGASVLEHVQRKSQRGENAGIAVSNARGVFTE